MSDATVSDMAASAIGEPSRAPVAPPIFPTAGQAPGMVRESESALLAPLPQPAAVMTAHLQISIAVKFRAIGITFANIAYNSTIALPPQVGLLAALAGPVHIFEFNHSGINIGLNLVDSPAE